MMNKKPLPPFLFPFIPYKKKTAKSYRPFFQQELKAARSVKSVFLAVLQELYFLVIKQHEVYEFFVMRIHDKTLRNVLQEHIRSIIFEIKSLENIFFIICEKPQKKTISHYSDYTEDYAELIDTRHTVKEVFEIHTYMQYYTLIKLGYYSTLLSFRKDVGRTDIFEIVAQETEENLYQLEEIRYAFQNN